MKRVLAKSVAAAVVAADIAVVVAAVVVVVVDAAVTVAAAVDVAVVAADAANAVSRATRRWFAKNLTRRRGCLYKSAALLFCTHSTARSLIVKALDEREPFQPPVNRRRRG